MTTEYNPYAPDPNLMKFVKSITDHLGYDFDEEKVKKITKLLQYNMDDRIDEIINAI